VELELVCVGEGATSKSLDGYKLIMIAHDRKGVIFSMVGLNSNCSGLCIYVLLALF
jgi:hypothetical protein